MPSAMRYMIFGLLCASLAGLFAQAWYVVVIAWAVGCITGLACGLSLDAIANWLERKSEAKDQAQADKPTTF